MELQTHEKRNPKAGIRDTGPSSGSPGPAMLRARNPW